MSFHPVIGRLYNFSSICKRVTWLLIHWQEGYRVALEPLNCGRLCLVTSSTMLVTLVLLYSNVDFGAKNLNLNLGFGAKNLNPNFPFAYSAAPQECSRALDSRITIGTHLRPQSMRSRGLQIVCRDLESISMVKENDDLNHDKEEQQQQEEEETIEEEVREAEQLYGPALPARLQTAWHSSCGRDEVEGYWIWFLWISPSDRCVSGGGWKQWFQFGTGAKEVEKVLLEAGIETGLQHWDWGGSLGLGEKPTLSYLMCYLTIAYPLRRRWTEALCIDAEGIFSPHGLL